MTADSSMMLGLSLRFNVKIDEADLGNWSKAEGLDVVWELAEYRAGDSGNFRWYYPAATKYQNITLTRAVNVKETGKVLDWLGKNSFASDKKRMCHIEMYDATNTAVCAHWDLEGVVPVHYTGPRFDAGASQIATETLVLAHLGFLDPIGGTPLAPKL
jgi:phage tail-like protein